MWQPNSTTPKKNTLTLMPKKTTQPGPSLWLLMVSRQQGLQPPVIPDDLSVNPSSEQVWLLRQCPPPKHKRHCLLPYFSFHLRPKPQRIVYLSSFYVFGLLTCIPRQTMQQPLRSHWNDSSQSLVICGHRLLSGSSHWDSGTAQDWSLFLPRILASQGPGSPALWGLPISLISPVCPRSG